MLDKIALENVFFIDIETVPQFPSYAELPENFRKLWDTKASRIKAPDVGETAEELYPRAGIYSEFGKIMCISLGFFRHEAGNLTFRVKSVFGDDEKKVLQGYNDIMKIFNPTIHFLCAHNGKEFDFPYIARRMVINGMKLPGYLDIAGKKPWESDYLLDTMQLWRFGDIKNYTSLELLCTVMGIPTPKDDIEGSDVWHVYWKDHALTRIVQYCEKDVVAIARLFMRFKNMEYIDDKNIVSLTEK